MHHTFDATVVLARMETGADSGKRSRAWKGVSQ